MKILCDRQALAEAFATASLFAAKNSPKPILQNVKLEATGDDEVTLTATDLELGATVKVAKASVDKPGRVVLPAASFLAILRENGDEKIQIQETSKNIVVKGERSEYKLASEDAAEFPLVTAGELTSYHAMPADKFRECILRTEYAATESERYALAGVMFEMSAGKMIAVATDGRRLSKVEYVADSVGGHSISEGAAIVPSRALKAIAKAIANCEGPAKLAVRSNDILIQTEQATFYSRLLEGRFPRWRDVFPNRTQSHKFELAADSLLSTIRQAAIMTSEESAGVTFSFAAGQLSLESSTSGKGKATVTMPVSYDGEPVEITLSHPFVADFLKIVGETSVTLDIENSQNAAVLTAGSYGYVVMPLSKDR